MKKLVLITSLYLILVAGIGFEVQAWGSGGSNPAPYRGRYTVLEVNRYVGQPSLNPSWNFHIDQFLDGMIAHNWSMGKYDTDENVTIEDIYFNLENSDILLFSGHGGPSTFWMSPVFQEYEFEKIDVDYHPWDIPFWQGGKKWIIFYSCETLHPDYLNDWKWVFSSDESSVHAILGVSSTVYSAPPLIARFIEYAFGDGVTQKTVWEAWRDGCLAAEYSDWMVFFLGGTKGETITSPINTFYDYDVWVAYKVAKTGIILYSTNPKYPEGVKNSPMVNKELANKRVKLNYIKPDKKNLYGIYVKPEIEDFSYYENDFYFKHGGELKGLYDLRKTDLGDRIRYTNNAEDIIYYKNSGAISYQRSLSSKRMDEGKTEKEKEKKLKNAAKIAEQFIQKYGGGLPEDAVLDNVSTTVMQNLTTGQTEIQSYIFHYSKFHDGIKVSGRAADGITIEVDAEGIAYYRRLWRTIEPNYMQTIYEKDLFDEAILVEKNVDKILGQFQMPLNTALEVNEVNLVYKGSAYDSEKTYMVLAWEYKVNDGLAFYIDALTGNVLD